MIQRLTLLAFVAVLVASPTASASAATTKNTAKKAVCYELQVIGVEHDAVGTVTIHLGLLATSQTNGNAVFEASAQPDHVIVVGVHDGVVIQAASMAATSEQYMMIPNGVAHTEVALPAQRVSIVSFVPAADNITASPQRLEKRKSPEVLAGVGGQATERSIYYHGRSASSVHRRGSTAVLKSEGLAATQSAPSVWRV